MRWRGPAAGGGALQAAQAWSLAEDGMLLLFEVEDCRCVLGAGGGRATPAAGHSRRCHGQSDLVGALAAGRVRSSGMVCIYILTALYL